MTDAHNEIWVRERLDGCLLLYDRRRVASQLLLVDVY